MLLSKMVLGLEASFKHLLLVFTISCGDSCCLILCCKDCCTQLLDVPASNYWMFLHPTIGCSCIQLLDVSASNYWMFIQLFDCIKYWSLALDYIMKKTLVLIIKCLTKIYSGAPAARKPTW